jgi:hypothetical protein
MRILARVIVGLALLALPAVALAAGTNRVYVPNCAKAVYKPKEIVLACGDDSSLLTKLTWGRWTSQGASGSGVYEVNDCTPDCVSGHFNSYPATVTLSRPKRCAKVKHHKVFGRVVAQYQGANPDSPQKLTDSLACPFG